MVKPVRMGEGSNVAEQGELLELLDELLLEEQLEEEELDTNELDEEEIEEEELDENAEELDGIPLEELLMQPFLRHE
jgi:hypothetical protein